MSETTTNIAERPGPIAVLPVRRRQSRFRPRARRGSALGWLLAVAALGAHLVVAPLLLGGTLPWTIQLIAASSIACLALAAYGCDSLASRVPAVLWVSLALLAWTVLQVSPLPCDLIQPFAAESVANLRAAHVALGRAPPTSCALSLDPGATQQEIVKGVAIVATLLAAWLLARGQGRRQIFWMVAISTLVMSLVALAHGILQLDSVFGMYAPLHVGRVILLAPLMNMNNLGGFTALGVPLWIGLTYRHGSKELRWVGGVAAAITFATALLTLSRGAIVQVCVGLLAMLAIIIVAGGRSRKKPASRAHWSKLGLAAIFVAGLAFVAYVGGEQVQREIADRDIGKLALLARAFEFATHHPWLGVGRGAFSSTFVRVEGQGSRFVYAENFLAQWAGEWGVPITLLWLGSVAFALGSALRGATSLARLGAATALLAFCLQNLVDLGFELVGVAVVAAALLGALIVPDGPHVVVRTRLGSARTIVAVVLVGALAALVLLAPRLTEQSIQALDGRLRASFQQRDRAKFRQTLERAVRVHPAEPIFAVIAATEALALGDASAPRWINRAMQLAPRWGAPHVLAYQMLWAHGLRDQALLELRKAAEGDADRTLTGVHVCRLAKQSGEYILRAAPVGSRARRRAFLESALGCAGVEYASSKAIEAALLQEFPESPIAYERKAYRLALDGEVDQSLDVLARLLARHPEFESARISRAEVLLRSNRLAETIAQVEVDLPRLPEHQRPSLIRRQVLALARLGDRAGMERALQAYRRLTSGTVDGLAESYAFEGYVQLELRQTGAALAAFREAYRINQDLKHLKAVAQLAGQLGDRPQQLWAYLTLCEREPLDPQNCAQRDRLLHPGTPPEVR